MIESYISEQTLENGVVFVILSAKAVNVQIYRSILMALFWIFFRNRKKSGFSMNVKNVIYMILKLFMHQTLHYAGAFRLLFLNLEKKEMIISKRMIIAME